MAATGGSGQVEQEWRGRVAVITGGGRGFGRAFGAALAARGAQVWLLDIDADAATDAASFIRSQGGRAEGRSCDVADEARVAAVITEIGSAHGGIDLLINNAGLHSAAYNEPMAALGIDKLRRLFEVNVIGVAICSLAARNLMRGRAGASIVNISSSAAYASGTAYGCSKLAVQGMTMTLAREFAADGIRVNAIAPGLILTDTIRNELAPERLARITAQQLLPDAGDERDIVEAMLHLASPRARFVTGETHRVSAGYALTI
jgi:3-oxoacyl-[acyl-carrier protein] reductase